MELVFCFDSIAILLPFKLNFIKQFRMLGQYIGVILPKPPRRIRQMHVCCQIKVKLLMSQHIQNDIANIDHSIITYSLMLIAQRNSRNTHARSQRSQTIMTDKDKLRLVLLEQYIELILLTVTDIE